VRSLQLWLVFTIPDLLSSQPSLIWNLFLVGKTSIEYILQSKYPVDGPTRSVTDVDWAPEPDLLVSTGIDSWLWAWDLRESRKPAFGFSAFNGRVVD
jgi:hypothetical protein